MLDPFVSSRETVHTPCATQPSFLCLISLSLTARISHKTSAGLMPSWEASGINAGTRSPSPIPFLRERFPALQS
jgi:hypothetical protein